MSNHQSHLDPPLVGMACRRHMNYLARETLFDFTPVCLAYKFDQCHPHRPRGIWDRRHQGIAQTPEAGRDGPDFSRGNPHARRPDKTISARFYQPGRQIPRGDPAGGHRRGVSMLAQEPNISPPRQNPRPLRPAHLTPGIRRPKRARTREFGGKSRPPMPCRSPQATGKIFPRLTPNRSSTPLFIWYIDCSPLSFPIHPDIFAGLSASRCIGPLR